VILHTINDQKIICDKFFGMSIFNTIFLAVREYCNRIPDSRPEISCFEEIAAKAHIPIENLEFYLDTLQNLGLIKYSWEKKTIRLTAFGKKQERLFA
jgi:hypothetical protein